MPFKSLVFNADQVRDFNTIGVTATDTTIRANSNTPDRLLGDDALNPVSSPPDGSNVLLPGEEVTQYRVTFEVDSNNEVIPGSAATVEFRTNLMADSDPWRDFYAETRLDDEGYGYDADGNFTGGYTVVFDGSIDPALNANGPDVDEFIAITSFHQDGTTGGYDPDGTGFMLADVPIAQGDTFTFSNTNNAESEFHVCFTTGMRVETEQGLKAVEDLQIGDMIKTYDNGYQPLRFVYRREVAAQGKHAPVIFEKGALGDNERFVVSQQHRICSNMVEKLENLWGEVLIEAVHFVNGTTIRVSQEHDKIEYFHLMFDNHELLWSENVLSESWQPHKRNLKRDEKLREELVSLFPELQDQAIVNAEPARVPLYPTAGLIQKVMQ